MRDAPLAYKGLRVYPRGFLGASVGIVAAPAIKPLSRVLMHHAYHPDMFRPPRTSVEVNQNVENAWSHYLRNSHATTHFEFREKILQVALEAFGGQDFKNWVKIQFEGPSTGELHAEFIEDTLRFISTGKRRMSLTNWEAVLTMTDIETNVTKHSKNIEDFFTHSSNKSAMNVKLTDVIARWCHHEGGFEDLIQTLHVLFGDVAV